MTSSTGSLRSRPLEETLAYAREIGAQLGITRVTEITYLDRFGLPVFSSVRPLAVAGSLCVSAGKGFLPLEAKVGAYMEAIELTYAELNRAQLPIRMLAAAHVGEGRFSLADLAPLAGQRSDANEGVACVPAREIRSGEERQIPAELVFFPYPKSAPGQRIFGSSGNALSSGNTREEAIVHALSEAIERDVMAFQRHKDDSELVQSDTLPAEVRALVDRADAIGYELVVRSAKNPFAMPFFIAALSERENRLASHFGTACHPRREIALRRAVTEAFQSRLTSIHGARDDLPDWNRRVAHLSRSDLANEMRDTLAKFASSLRAVRYQDIFEHETATTVSAALPLLLDAIERVTSLPPLYVALTPEALPLQVVRVIAPRLETNFPWLPRVGPRLRAELKG